MLVGTPAYLAPERIDGHPATAQSDLYSLGVLLYEALAGTKPFPGTTPLAVANAVRNGSFTPLAEARPDADPRLVRVASKAMALRPADRYASAEEMRAALEDEPSITVFAPRPVPTATVDATVPVTALTLSGPTMVAPAPDAAPEAVPEPGREAGVDRRLLLVCGAGLVALLLIAAYLNLGGGGSSSPAAAASDANKALAVQMRALGDRVHDGDGAQGPTVQQRLDKVADDLDGAKPAAGADATALLRDVTAWRQDPKQLSAAAADQSTALLKQVPGVDAAAATTPTTPVTTATAPPTTAAPTVTAKPAPRPPAPKHGGKGKKDG